MLGIRGFAHQSKQKWTPGAAGTKEWNIYLPRPPYSACGRLFKWKDEWSSKSRSGTAVHQDDILHVETSKPSGRWFAFAPSTKTSFGSSDPLLPDPFEERVVAVRGSQMEGGGQGVFAKVPLYKGAVALIFNGYKVP